MLGVWVPVGLEARNWGFDVTFLLFLGFSGALLLFFFVFLLFLCPFCILLVCLGAPLRFFNEFVYLSKKDSRILSTILSCSY
jgi:hypothetical protein